MRTNLIKIFKIEHCVAFSSALPWIMALLWCVTNERIHTEVPKSTACFAAKICGHTDACEGSNRNDWKGDHLPVTNGMPLW